MRKENRWKHGATNIVFPPLPADLKGRPGCQFHRFTFDPAVGEEICLVYREEPKFAASFSNVDPFNLIAKSGAVPTPYGTVAFILWKIAAFSAQQVLVEHFLNPHGRETIRFVATAANQTHLKLFVINNVTTETTAFVDFENVFELDRFALGMASVIEGEPEGDFDAAQQYVMRTIPVSELLGSGEPADKGTRAGREEFVGGFLKTKASSEEMERLYDEILAQKWESRAAAAEKPKRPEEGEVEIRGAEDAVPGENGEGYSGRAQAYARLHRKYLEENHPDTYQRLKESGELIDYLKRVGQTAEDRYEDIHTQMAIAKDLPKDHSFRSSRRRKYRFRPRRRG